jgi:hypothetical protein
MIDLIKRLKLVDKKLLVMKMAEKKAAKLVDSFGTKLKRWL